MKALAFALVLMALPYPAAAADPLLLPGIVVPITEGPYYIGFFNQMKQEHVDYMLARIPMGRFLELDEVAALICWLSSEECSFSTGAVFDISGGRATY